MENRQYIAPLSGGAGEHGDGDGGELRRPGLPPPHGRALPASASTHASCRHALILTGTAEVNLFSQFFHQFPNVKPLF